MRTIVASGSRSFKRKRVSLTNTIKKQQKKYSKAIDSEYYYEQSTAHYSWFVAVSSLTGYGH